MSLKIKWSHFSLIVIFIALRGHADPIFDIETLPSLRTKQYRMHPYSKVVVFSASRTGSSLVYNVLRFLFEKEENFCHSHDKFHEDCLVLKTHKDSDMALLKDEPILYVIPIRNPTDACVSNYRICPLTISNMQEFCEKIVGRQGNCLAYAENIKAAGRQVVFIKYEDFVDNLEYFLDFIERNFPITISEGDKNIIKKGYAKENVFTAIKDLEDFKVCLPLSGFHGKHVALDTFTPPDIFLYWLNFYLEDIKPLFKKYGYFSE